MHVIWTIRYEGTRIGLKRLLRTLEAEGVHVAHILRTLEAIGRDVAISLYVHDKDPDVTGEVLYSPDLTEVVIHLVGTGTVAAIGTAVYEFRKHRPSAKVTVKREAQSAEGASSQAPAPPAD